MRRTIVLMALVWVPFVSIFVFANATVTGAYGDSHPHLVFHVLSSASLLAGLVLAVRLHQDRGGARLVRLVLVLVVLCVLLAVVGNTVELVAATQRLAADGWVSRPTPDLFGPDAGLHAAGASLTIPAHLAAMLLTLVLVGLETARARRPRRDTRPVPVG